MANSQIDKFVIILSDKSSGSSMLQNELGKHPQINRIKDTVFNYESKYWEYATSILRKPQPRMQYSHEFPIRAEKAVFALNKLFSLVKLPMSFSLKSGKEDLFNGWTALCSKFNPVFLEKSPHHLHFWEALILMHEYSQLNPEVDVKYIGLIRNPMDTLYSMWQRWYAIPERRQFEWLRAYENLLKFKDIVTDTMMIVKYEDIVSKNNVLREIYEFLDLDHTEVSNSSIHRKSLQKWKDDSNYGFVLDDQVMDFAEQFYSKLMMDNSETKFWKYMRAVRRPNFRMIIAKRRIRSFLKKVLLDKL